MTDEELIKGLRAEAEAMRQAVNGIDTDGYFHRYNWEDKPHRVVYDAANRMKAAADRIEALVEAFGILEDALQEVGDDYPGSSLQEWCQQQVRFARFALEGN